MSDIVLLYTTWPDEESVERAAAEALDQGLAACVNILAPMRSVFRWDGALTRNEEIPAFFKTTRACAEALSARLSALHPFETPAILALEVRAEGSHAPFLQWVAAETHKNQTGDGDFAT
jgi:periplasmic divalent cation tolerance protein